MRRARYGVLGIVTAVGLALTAPLGLPAQAAGEQTQADAAPGGPGALSHFDLARKDCLGTARNRTSKVWYTVAGGVLSDVYYPTVDNTNVETLQYIVTDGSTFTDLQTRDMTYTVRALDPGGMACQVTATAKNGRYRIVTDSDGLVQLDKDRALGDTFTDAANGNLVQTARLDLARGSGVTLALGFGGTQADAVKTAGASLGNQLDAVLARYVAGWVAYDRGLRSPGGAFRGLPVSRQLE